MTTREEHWLGVIDRLSLSPTQRASVEALVTRERQRAYAAALEEVEGLIRKVAGYEPDDDPEIFCPRCLAGVDSAEHAEKCYRLGIAEMGETA